MRRVLIVLVAVATFTTVPAAVSSAAVQQESAGRTFTFPKSFDGRLSACDPNAPEDNLCAYVSFTGVYQRCFKKGTPGPYCLYQMTTITGHVTGVDGDDKPCSGSVSLADSEFSFALYAENRTAIVVSGDGPEDFAFVTVTQNCESFVGGFEPTQPPFTWNISDEAFWTFQGQVNGEPASLPLSGPMKIFWHGKLKVTAP